jgi:uncharacterized protein YigE (DUF2233 family)
VLIVTFSISLHLMSFFDFSHLFDIFLSVLRTLVNDNAIYLAGVIYNLAYKMLDYILYPGVCPDFSPIIFLYF